MNLNIGPAGLGPVKEAIKNLETYHKAGLNACEISFTYGPYIKKEEDAKAIGKRAKELGIYLSIHAHYWINLNSAEPEKIEASKKRILECLRIGTLLGAKRVIFHPGYYTKKKGSKTEFEKEETYQQIKREMLDLQHLRKAHNYTPLLAPETTGKVNVFGSIEETARLVRDTQCSFAIDFAHILARDKDYRFKDVEKLFGMSKEWHIHFSGIAYGEKGEKKHIPTEEKDIKILLKHLPSTKRHFIISEAPDPFGDAKKILREAKKRG